MTVRLKDYEEIVGSETLTELDAVASHVRHLKLQNINSTAVGGGVAEILTRIIPFLNELGVQATWDVIKGDEAFFEVTKAFHNALHGKREEISDEMLQVYRATTEANLETMDLHGDMIFVHDPQPAGLIARRKQGQYWGWRCHIDVSSPQQDVWNFLHAFVRNYDLAVFSMPDFAQTLDIPQYMIAPSIDPLSEKNKELEAQYVTGVLEKYGVDPGRPILTQVSRFDRLKDPLGVIKAYRMVRKKLDCQLVLAGGTASDDPEGEQVLAEIHRESEADPDIHVLLLPPFSDLEINALVRGSTIVLQKSLREGFGLTVTEALWKKKPVIGGAVGGIRLQVLDGVTGFLVHSSEGAAHRAIQLLSDPRLCTELGENGHLHVKQNFLILRHLKDYMLMMLALQYPNDDIVDLV